jgi:hypothetical protein
MFHLKTNISDFISPFINDKKRQRHDWNPIAHNTRLSSSSVNPKLNQRLEPESLRLLTQLWIDAYSKGYMFTKIDILRFKEEMLLAASANIYWDSRKSRSRNHQYVLVEDCASISQHAELSNSSILWLMIFFGKWTLWKITLLLIPNS